MLVVIPSRFESFGLIAAEALARGIPVVGFALPALEEIVTPECGILVPCFDTERLSDALRALLCDPNRRREMGTAARRRGAAFDWSVAAGRTGTVLPSCCGRVPAAIAGPKAAAHVLHTPGLGANLSSHHCDRPERGFREGAR